MSDLRIQRAFEREPEAMIGVDFFPQVLDPESEYESKEILTQEENEKEQ